MQQDCYYNYSLQMHAYYYVQLQLHIYIWRRNALLQLKSYTDSESECTYIYIVAMTEAARTSPSCLTPRQLCLQGRVLPPALPLIISSNDNWNSDSLELVTAKKGNHDHTLKLVDDTLELLCSINKPLAVLSICGPFRSGKSYLMSRILGMPGTFKSCHGMRACTHGIWMATTVLECQEFATIVLDTEGIDAVGASENMAMSLLTLTTLLSSFLIYNSKRVPQNVDLDKMRCFSQLSTSLLAQRDDHISKKFFPHFLWLLRDVCLTILNRQGEPISPTEFLHTRILTTKCGEPTELGRSLCSLFPSLECSTLPIPSSKRDIIRNIVERQDELKPAFNTAVDKLIQQILCQVTPKMAIDGVNLVNGCTLATLIISYVDTINTPGAVPDLGQGWQAVIRRQLKEYCVKLVKEYENEMEESVKGNLPMEMRDLMRLHEQLFISKKNSLEQEIHRIDPLNITAGDNKCLLAGLEQELIKWSEPSEESEMKVNGGILYHFFTQNFSESRTHCEEVFRRLLTDSEIKDKCDEAVMASKPLNIDHEVEVITECYHREAIGPAARKVLDDGLGEINKLKDTLKMIPGKPRNVKILGRDFDRVKLGWDPPVDNPEATEIYIISKRVEGGVWEEAVQTKNTKALITGLDGNQKYEFTVMATNKLMESIKEEQSSLTPQSRQQMATKKCSS